MGAYSEVYLQEIVETQGDFFENIRDYVPGIDVRNFIEVYMSGKTRSYIDQAKAYVCTMNAEQLWEYFRRGEFFQPKEGNGIGDLFRIGSDSFISGVGDCRTDHADRSGRCDQEAGEKRAPL